MTKLNHVILGLPNNFIALEIVIKSTTYNMHVSIAYRKSYFTTFANPSSFIIEMS